MIAKFDASSGISRRQFIGGTFAAAAATSLPVFAANEPSTASSSTPAPAPRTEFKRKIKVGVIGNGGRGAWIAKLFKEHGGYELWALADYFPSAVDACGDELGVDRSRRFSTLSGYKRLIESGVDAVAIETPPYFMPEQSLAAIEAGLHVYMAKPVAVDVPGALQIEATGKLATASKRCFLIDYQIPTDPVNIEIVRRIHEGGLGRIAHVSTTGLSTGCKDQRKGPTIEDRLQHLVWVNDVALGCDYIGNFDIHAIDAALWALQERPVAAMGSSSIRRPEPYGDARDVCSLVYEYESGVVHSHFGQALKDNIDMTLCAAIYGTEANAMIEYTKRSFLRGGKLQDAGGQIKGLYKAGAERNIARFYREITGEQFENDTIRRSVDGVLACVLGYEAAARNTRLTMDEVLRANRRLEVDLTGLKT